MVLPNGPEMAASFVAIACGATTAPLNPAYKPDEFDFYLADLNARALVIQRGMDSPAREVAAARGIPIVELDRRRGGAGRQLHPGSAVRLRRPAACTSPGPAQADDIALVLHTSGTTSRPKIVPLRQVNVTASAYHIADGLALTPDDVCLNIMPLFHIHGLIAATLSSLAAGAAVSLHARLQRLPLLRLVRRGPPDLVHRRADDAPGDPGSRAAPRGARSRPAGCASSARPPPRCRRR